MSAFSSLRKMSRGKALLLGGLVLLLALGLYVIQKTPPAAVSDPSLTRLTPAPKTSALLVRIAGVAEMRRLLSRPPWSDVLDPALMSQLAGRGAFPEEIARLDRAEARWILRLISGEAGVLKSAGESLAVARLGIVGRSAFNLFRWTGPWRGRCQRNVFSATPGVTLLSADTGRPFLHAAMRGAYLFVSRDEATLKDSLGLAEGSLDRVSLESLLPRPSGGEEDPHLTVAFLGPDRPPRVASATLTRDATRVVCRYGLRETLPTADPKDLLEAASSIPKTAGIFISMTSPPAVAGGMSSRWGSLRDRAAEWIALQSGDALRILEEEIQGPFTIAASGWVEIPGHVPFPSLAVSTKVRDTEQAMTALDEILRASLHSGLSRSEVQETGVTLISYRNEGYLGPLAPSATASAQRILLASTESYLRESIAAAEGRLPCLNDKPGFPELQRFAGSAPAAALVFASGEDLARLASDLLLKLASGLGPTAAGDTRDLLVPAAERLRHFARIYGRLEAEPATAGEPGHGLGRLELRLELEPAPGAPSRGQTP